MNTIFHEQIKFNKQNSTGLKGIAILLMLFHHNFRDVVLFENYTVSFFPFPQDLVVSAADMSKICVSIFVFISGYGLYLSCKNTKLDATKWTAVRYIKTMSGYWMIWILSCVVTQLINRRVSKIYVQNSLWEAVAGMGIDFLGLANLFRTPTLNGTWWYMSAAIVFILLTPLLVKNREKLWLILAGVILFIRVIMKGKDFFPGGTAVYSFLTPFILGMIFARNNYIERLVNQKHKLPRFLVEVVLLLAAYKVYKNLPISNYWEVHWGLIPLLVIVFCIEYILVIPGIKQVLVFLGKHSMNVFLVHTFIRLIYLGEFTYSWKHFVLITLVLLVVSLALSFVLEGIKKITKYDQLMEIICKKIENI